VLNTIGNLVLVPLFLSRWSAGTYGEWLALSAVVAYCSVIDLGMNSAAGNAMTSAYARGDVGRYRHLHGSAMAFYVGAASGVSVIVALLAAVLPIAAWTGIQHIPPRVASWIAFLLASRLLWQMPAAQLGSIYRTIGDLSSTQWISNLQSSGLLAITAAVLLFHGGVLSLALWSTVPMAIVTAGAALRLRRTHPELLPRLSEATLTGLRELLAPSLLFGLIMLSMALTIQGPVLLVSRALGGTAVALLATTRTLANFGKQMAASVQLALWPEMTRLDAVGAASALRLGHRLVVAGSTALCAAFAGALWFQGAEVLQAWTMGRITPDTTLLRLLLFALVMQAPWLASSLFTTANNRHRRLAFYYAISAVLTLGATAALLRRFGVLAVPLGGLAGEALACYHFVIKEACRVLNEDYPRFAARLWPAVIAISCASWGAGYLGSSIAVGPEPLRWLQAGAATTLAAGLAAWFAALREEDRSLLIHFVVSRPSAPALVNADSPS
jgi:O-antigen/teichoic acid export membrane protein